MKETGTERKRLTSLLLGCAVFAIALLLRAQPGTTPPFDDVYHVKRIEFTAQHFPHVLDFDPDRGERGEFCPWPPLYDFALGGFTRFVLGPRSSVLGFLPVVFFALFAGVVTAAMTRYGPLAALTAGLTLAISPYLIGVSSVWHLDHHYVEPLLLLLIVYFASRRNGIALGIAISIALLVQTALLVAAGVAFLALFFSDDAREGAKAFAIAAIVILLYRLTRPPGYPDSAWFLGYPHIALLAGAAIACAMTVRFSRTLALAAGASIALAFPQVFAGLRFFGGDPWLRSILEFQPMFHNAGYAGTDIANLTGGAVLAPLVWRRHRTFALFAIVYLLLALSSRRFLVTAITLLAVGGGLFVAERMAGSARAGWRAGPTWLAALFVVLPPLIYDVYTFGTPEPSNEAYRVVALRLCPLPRGRVLAPWSFGHAIDVIGKKPVVIDNFGSMPDERVFTDAIAAMLATRDGTLLRYCRDRNIRYLVLPHPAYVPAMAATIGLDPELYSRSRLASRTVWARLYRGDTIAGFTRISDAALSIWKIE